MNKINIDYYTILKELRIYCESTGRNLQWLEPGQNVPKADMAGTIHIKKPDPAWTEEEFTVWRASVYHEIDHVKPRNSDDYELLKKLKISADSTMANVLNCLVDHKIEHAEHGEYIGRDRYLSKGNQIHLQELAEKFQKADWDKIDDTMKNMAVLAAGDAASRASWQRDLIGLDNSLSATFTPEMREKLKKMENMKSDLYNMTTAEDCYEMTKRILEEIFELDPEEEQKKAQQQYVEGGEGEEGQGQKGQQAQGGDGPSDKGKKAKKSEQDGVIKWEDMQRHEHKESGPSFSSLTIDYSGYKRGATYVPSNQTVHKASTLSTDNSYKTRVNRAGVKYGLSNSVRRKLLARAQAIEIYGQKSGKIHDKSLHKLISTQGEAQTKVYKKKIDNHILDTAVSVLVDFSGSMGGDGKMTNAIISTMMLNDAIAKIGVPVEILGFTDNHLGGVIYEVKTHAERIDNQEVLTRMSNAAGHDMSSNADGESILYAYSRLRVRPETRKLLIVISDGQPSGGNGDIVHFTKQVVQSIEAKRDVEIYGIGVNSNEVKKFYKHNAVINSPSQLEGALLTVISNYIIK